MGLPSLPPELDLALKIIDMLTRLGFSKLFITQLEVDSPDYAEIKKGLMDLESLIPQIEGAEIREKIRSCIDFFNNHMKKQSIQ